MEEKKNMQTNSDKNEYEILNKTLNTAASQPQSGSTNALSTIGAVIIGVLILLSIISSIMTDISIFQLLFDL